MTPKTQGTGARVVETRDLEWFAKAFPHFTGRALVVSKTSEEALRFLKMQAQDVRGQRGSGMANLAKRDDVIKADPAQRAQALRALGTYNASQQILMQTAVVPQATTIVSSAAAPPPTASLGNRLSGLKMFVIGQGQPRRGGQRNGGTVVTGPPSGDSGGNGMTWVVPAEGQPPQKKSGSSTNKLLWVVLALTLLFAALSTGRGLGLVPAFGPFAGDKKQGQPTSAAAQVLPTVAAPGGVLPQAQGQPTSQPVTAGQQQDLQGIQQQLLESYLKDYRDVVVSSLGAATDPDMGQVGKAVAMYRGNVDKVQTFIDSNYGKPPAQYQQVLDNLRGGLDFLTWMAAALQSSDWVTAKEKALEYEQTDANIRQQLVALGVQGLPNEPASMTGLLATWEANQKARLAQGQQAPTPVPQQVPVPQPRQPAAAPPPAAPAPAPGAAVPVAPPAPAPVIQPATATPVAIAQVQRDWAYGDRRLSYNEAYGEVSGWAGGCDASVDKAALADTIMRWGIANQKQLQGYEAAHGSQCHPVPPTNTPAPPPPTMAPVAQVPQTGNQPQRAVVPTVADQPGLVEQAWQGLQDAWDYQATPAYLPTWTPTPYRPPPTPVCDYYMNTTCLTESQVDEKVAATLAGYVGRCISVVDQSKINAVKYWACAQRSCNFMGIDDYIQQEWCRPTPEPTPTPQPKIYTYSELKAEMPRWNNKVYVHSRDSDGNCMFSGGIRGQCPSFVSSGWIGQLADMGKCKWEGQICWWQGA